MKPIILFFAIVIGGMLYLQHVLQNGAVLHYIDTHVQDPYVPEAAYVIGQGYYLLQDLPEATTYFIRVAERYPKRPLGDNAFFSYLQCLDDSASTSRAELVVGYQAYLERYPTGKHVDIVKIRLDNYQTGAH